MKEQIPLRRTVLRAVSAAGCSLWIPIALSGCDAKKGTDASSPSPPAGKVAQASVQYQAEPKGEQKCSNCVNFIPESSTCKLVEGKISPEGWCSLWTKKA